MADTSPASGRAGIVRAQIHGTVLRYARRGPLSAEDMAGAVAELGEILAGRDDGPELLAEVAGLVTGARAGWPELTGQAVTAAAVCIAAGADERLIDAWCSIGAERVAGREAPPSSRAKSNY